MSSLRYLDNGYVDMQYMIEHSETFLFSTGGRGTGKTYGCLQYIAENYNDSKEHKFMYVRRRGTEADGISTEATNPFYDLTAVKGSKWYKRDVPLKPYKISKDMVAFKTAKDSEHVIGYLTALTTFYKIKSIPFPDVDLIFYDEFIPMSGTQRIKSEYETLLQMYETINRNRELDGEKPVKLVAVSNAETIGNAIYIGLKVVNRVLSLQKEGKSEYHNSDRGISIVLMRNSPISEKKKATALYKLSAGSEYELKALNNNFLYDDRLVKSIKLSGYIPIVQIGELLIYRHKTEGKYYCKVGKNAGVPEYLATDEDIKRMQLGCSSIYRAYIGRRILFESMESQTIFLMYWNM